MIKWFNQQRPASVLGLTVEGTRLEGVVLRRTNGSLQLQQSFSATLALNPLSAEPELVGREIRNHLDKAGIRERRCVFCVPTACVLMRLVEIPELPDADVDSFLQLEAERSFHHGPETLVMATRRFRSPGGKQFAAILAVPRNQVLNVERALRAALLKPASFSLGLETLARAAGSTAENSLCLAPGESQVELLADYAGGLTALRCLETTVEVDEFTRHLSPEVAAREIRITLGQLPDEVRAALKRINVFGGGEQGRQFAAALEPLLASRGLSVTWIGRYPEHAFPKRLPPEAPMSGAFSLAARYVAGAEITWEFLPPKIHTWQQLATRFGSRKLAWAGGAAACIFLLVGALMMAQQWQLSRLESQWAGMAPKVKVLEDIQQQVRQFRPWFDDSFRSLTILRQLTEAFPEEGIVTAKILEIRNLSSVTCSGVARDNPAFLKVLDQLRAAKDISDLKVEQMRGKTPMQFSFKYQWGNPVHEQP